MAAAETITEELSTQKSERESNLEKMKRSGWNWSRNTVNTSCLYYKQIQLYYRKLSDTNQRKMRNGRNWSEEILWREDYFILYGQMRSR